MREASKIYINQRSALKHYLSMVDNNYKILKKQGEYVNLKKYFYCIRPILCCKWIFMYNSIPPVRFDELEGIKKLVDELVELKKEQKETSPILQIDSLNKYIEDYYQIISGSILDKNDPVNNYDILDKLFIKCLKDYGELNV